MLECITISPIEQSKFLTQNEHVFPSPYTYSKQIAPLKKRTELPNFLPKGNFWIT